HKVPLESVYRLLTRPPARPSDAAYAVRVCPSVNCTIPPSKNPSHTPAPEGSGAAALIGSFRVNADKGISSTSRVASLRRSRPATALTNHSALRPSSTIARVVPPGIPLTGTNRPFARYPTPCPNDIQIRFRLSSKID